MINKMIKPQTLKGFRDFLPREARKRQYVIDSLKSVFESYGFEPLKTPALEYEEILLGKYGEEGDKLMYRFTDRGDRNVALRYDQTVPLARVVAQYGSTGSPQVLPMPFKRYQIQPVWRAENTQKGRYRELVQCDIDTVGTSSLLSDAEILAIIWKSYTLLGFSNIKILVNDRRIFADLSIKAITIIDKLKKIGEENVKAELKRIGVEPEVLDRLLETKVSENLLEIIQTAQRLGVSETAISFSPTLARGLDYYTGLVIEVESPDYTAGSLGGGGRYDNLIGMFTNKQIPAVGFAFGFDRLIEAMEELKLFPVSITESATKVLVTIFSEEFKERPIEVCSIIRMNGINCELFLDDKTSLEKQLKYADQKGIPYVIIIGPDEAKNNALTLRNMKTREQKTLSRDQLLNEIRTQS